MENQEDAIHELTEDETNKRLLENCEEIQARHYALLVGIIDIFFNEAVERYIVFPSWADASGEVVERRLTPVAVPDTLNDLLAEYSGLWEASYERGCGKQWLSLESGLAQDTLCFEYFFEAEEPDIGTLYMWAYGGDGFGSSAAWMEAENHFENRRQSFLDSFEGGEEEDGEEEGA